MEIRLARNEEGLEVKALFDNAENLPDSDYQDIYPYWVVAIHEGKIIAALQLCMSRPTGRLEHLLVDKTVNKITATKAAHKLIKYGEVAMKANGCTMVAGYVAFKTKPIKNLIKKHYGAQVINSGSMLMWRIK